MNIEQYQADIAIRDMEIASLKNLLEEIANEMFYAAFDDAPGWVSPAKATPFERALCKKINAIIHGIDEPR